MRRRRPGPGTGGEGLGDRVRRACGAHQTTIDALEAYGSDEDVVTILGAQHARGEDVGRVAVFDAIRASGADAV